MWISLFIFALGVGLCFATAAIVLQSPTEPLTSSKPGRANRSLASSLDFAAALAPPALLVSRMRSLALEPDEMRRIDPAMLQDLAARCDGCTEQARCTRDLAAPSIADAVEVLDDRWPESWRDYCPNGAMLNTLRTLRECCATLSPA